MKIKPKLLLTAIMFVLICLNSCFFRPRSSEEGYMKKQRKVMYKEQKRAYKATKDKFFTMQSVASQEQMKLSKKRSKKLNKGRKKSLVRRRKKCSGSK